MKDVSSNKMSKKLDKKNLHKLHQVFMYLFLYQNVSILSNCKNPLYFFFSFFGMQTFDHLLGCYAIGINSSLSLF